METSSNLIQLDSKTWLLNTSSVKAQSIDFFTIIVPIDGRSHSKRAPATCSWNCCPGQCILQWIKLSANTKRPFNTCFFVCPVSWCPNTSECVQPALASGSLCCPPTSPNQSIGPAFQTFQCEESPKNMFKKKQEVKDVHSTDTRDNLILAKAGNVSIRKPQGTPKSKTAREGRNPCNKPKKELKKMKSLRVTHAKCVCVWCQDWQFQINPRAITKWRFYLCASNFIPLSGKWTLSHTFSFSSLWKHLFTSAPIWSLECHISENLSTFPRACLFKSTGKHRKHSQANILFSEQQPFSMSHHFKNGISSPSSLAHKHWLSLNPWMTFSISRVTIRAGLKTKP